MKSHIVIASLLLASLCVLASAADDSAARTQQSSSHHTSVNAKQSPTDPGERVFASNCSRCHTPPMTLPQRITGTVLMHMRVRARLSRQDEQVLLRYMAP